MLKNKKVVFIGGGNMAEALLKGCIASGVFKPSQVIVTDIKSERLKYIEEKYKVKTSLKNVNPVSDADIIVLAIKPQNIEEALKEVASVINKSKLIVSIAAGISIKQLQKKADWKIVRVMPNTPALIGEGISALCNSTNVSKSDLDIAEGIFKAVGKTVQVQEKDINSVTALSGSGPAFVYRFIDHFIEAGSQMGLSKEVVQELVLQTYIGAAKMVAETQESPEVLAQKVASPGGTTEAGLKVLDNSVVKEEILKTLKAAKKRADELAEGE